jgi:hypothetical protein
VQSVTGVNVTPANDTIDVGTQLPLVATVIPGGVPQTVTWSSADPAIATVSQAGVVTGVFRGITTITATSTADVTKTGSATITVRGVINVTLSPVVDSVRVGATRTFTPMVFADAGVSTAATLSSQDPTIATINPTTGVATAIAVGVATIRATAVADVTKTATAFLRVLSPCSLPIITAIGQTTNATITASSCGDGLVTSEMIAYPGNPLAPALDVTGNANFRFNFAPINVPRGNFFFGGMTTATTVHVWAGAGMYRSYIWNSNAGQFGSLSWTTAAVAPKCGYVMSATQVTVGPFPVTTNCNAVPFGAPFQLSPAGTYYGNWVDIIPPLAAGESYTIQVVASGFTPRIALWADADGIPLIADGTGSTATLSHTSPTGGYHRVILTSTVPGQTGSMQVTLLGPNPLSPPGLGNTGASGGGPLSGLPLAGPALPRIPR